MLLETMNVEIQLDQFRQNDISSPDFSIFPGRNDRDDEEKRAPTQAFRCWVRIHGRLLPCALVAYQDKVYELIYEHIYIYMGSPTFW